MGFKKILLVHKETKYSNSDKALAAVSAILKEKKLKFKTVPISLFVPQDLDGIDLLIVLGGDGTILKATNTAKKIPILAIKSDPEESEGALTEFVYTEKEKIYSALSGKYYLKKRQRLVVSINGFEMPEQVLNEVFIGSNHSFKIAKYVLNYKHCAEVQKSSGIIITTGTGSNAWYSSAGGKAFAFDLKEAKFLVREPYITTKQKCKTFSGTLDETFMVESKRDDQIVSIDSSKQYPINKGDKITITFGEGLEFISLAK